MCITAPNALRTNL